MDKLRKCLPNSRYIRHSYYSKRNEQNKFCRLLDYLPPSQVGAACYGELQKFFHWYILKRDLTKPHFYSNTTKYFQNKFILFCLELWYSGEKYSYRCSHSACQHRQQHISKRNYEISVVQEVHMSRLELQRWPLLLIPFLKHLFRIWDWGLANLFWDHVIQISVRNIYACLVWIFIFDTD